MPSKRSLSSDFLNRKRSPRSLVLWTLGSSSLKELLASHIGISFCSTAPVMHLDSLILSVFFSAKSSTSDVIRFRYGCRPISRSRQHLGSKRKKAGPTWMEKSAVFHSYLPERSFRRPAPSTGESSCCSARCRCSARSRISPSCMPCISPPSIRRTRPCAR